MQQRLLLSNTDQAASMDGAERLCLLAHFCQVRKVTTNKSVYVASDCLVSAGLMLFSVGDPADLGKTFKPC